jgi:4,4'-diaponeurosporenoate glycosyltransferase
VVIPARNEEENLPVLLESLRRQRIRAGRVVVVDDHSSDGTAEAARSHGAEVLTPPPVPEGWTGKSWACDNGALHCGGRKILFVDADVNFSEDAIARLLTAAERHPVVSVQPYHSVQRWYESLSAFPNLVVLAGIGPFGACTQRRPPNGLFGPCILVERELYERSGGHGEVASSVVEDIELADLFIRAGARPAVYAGGEAVRFRMYPGGVRSLIEGWRKNLSSGSERSYRCTRFFISLWFSGIIGTVFSWIAAAHIAEPETALVGGGLWCVYALQTGMVLRPVGRFGPWPALLYPLYLGWFLFLAAASGYMTRIHASVSWKGRKIGIQPSVRPDKGVKSEEKRQKNTEG